ncbi:MAG: prepilin-type N-terminal cleavage/methylation domain-containing protein [Pseudomonadota bacterium]
MKHLIGPQARRREQDVDGFSLLEVLVATTLMGVLLVVLLQVLTTALRAQETSLDHIQALLVAEKVLQENCGAQALAAATYQGRDGRFDYLVQVTPQYEVSNPHINQLVRCSLIQVTVSWRQRDQAKSLALQTIRTAVQKKS